MVIVLRAAGLSAMVAIIGLIVSGITIALFFGGAGDFWGPVNDLAVAVTLVALVLPVLAVDRLARPEVGIWIGAVSAAAIAGIVLTAVGQVLLVVGVIDLKTSFVTGGIGILPIFVWLLAVAFLALGPGILPAQIGWLAIGVVALSAGITALAGITTGPVLWVAAAALLVVIAGCLGSLGATLLSEGTTIA